MREERGDSWLDESLEHVVTPGREVEVDGAVQTNVGPLRGSKGT